MSSEVNYSVTFYGVPEEYIDALTDAVRKTINELGLASVKMEWILPEPVDEMEGLGKDDWH